MDDQLATLIVRAAAATFIILFAVQTIRASFWKQRFNILENHHEQCMELKDQHTEDCNQAHEKGHKDIMEEVMRQLAHKKGKDHGGLF